MFCFILFPEKKNAWRFIAKQMDNYITKEMGKVLDNNLEK